MNEYIINVAMSFIPYAGWAFLFFALSFGIAYVGSIPVEYKLKLTKYLRVASILVIILGCWISSTSTSNTWKNNTLVERKQRNDQLQQMNTSKTIGPISDVTKKPGLSEEERKERFDSLKNYSD